MVNDDDVPTATAVIVSVDDEPPATTTTGEPPAAEATTSRDSTTTPEATPVFIQLVPFVENGAQTFLVASGFARNVDPEIHRLSTIVLQLAMTNFALSFLIELIVLIRAIVQKQYIAIMYFIFWVAFAYWVMWLGIRGVKTKNEPCCHCDHDCGYLEAFRYIYVFLACLRAIMLIVSIVFFHVTDFLFNVLFLILLSATADYSRRLLVVIHRPARNVVAARATVDTVPMADARHVPETST